MSCFVNAFVMIISVRVDIKTLAAIVTAHGGEVVSHPLGILFPLSCRIACYFAMMWQAVFYGLIFGSKILLRQLGENSQLPV